MHKEVRKYQRRPLPFLPPGRCWRGPAGCDGGGSDIAPALDVVGRFDASLKETRNIYKTYSQNPHNLSAVFASAAEAPCVPRPTLRSLSLFFSLRL